MDKEVCKTFSDFIDGKKNLHFNSTEDFSTLKELFRAAVEKETDWKEQAKIVDFPRMVCRRQASGII